MPYVYLCLVCLHRWLRLQNEWGSGYAVTFLYIFPLCLSKQFQFQWEHIGASIGPAAIEIIDKVRAWENREFWPPPLYAFRTFDRPPG